ncbi:MAG: hypothetical protein R3314_02710 [Longimicrobiales bacterium]|nr:hypothetical protein [Longimicrobiales bacterium]
MFESLLGNLPPAWRDVIGALVSLVAWIPAWQERVIAMVLSPDASWLAIVASWVLLALPALLVVVAMWVTMLSVYTLPFRSGRGQYLRTLAFSWWDAGRGITVYWAGVARFVMTAGGLLWAGVRYAVMTALRVVRSLVSAPAAALDWTARRYFQPGVPWLAFVLILGWSALEAGVFTFTLRPTMYEVLYDLTGAPPNAVVLTGVLYALLFLLIVGSFACIQVLKEAIEARKPKEIVQMLFVELFVMFFEVVFLYRELIDAITPWIAQQTGGAVRLGLWSTLALASFGWIGIRGMTWFLFGRYGTPAVMAIVSRETLDVGAGASVREQDETFGWWRDMVADLKKEQAWLRKRAEELGEALALPILQLLAAGLNFCLILVSSRPAFELPFESLDEAMARLPGGRDGDAIRPQLGGGTRPPATGATRGEQLPEEA